MLMVSGILDAHDLMDLGSWIGWMWVMTHGIGYRDVVL